MHQKRQRSAYTRSRLHGGAVGALFLGLALIGGCESMDDSGASASERAADARTPALPGGRTPGVSAPEPDIRVRIQKGARDAAVSGPQRFVIRPAAGRTVAMPRVVTGPLAVSSGDRGVTVKEASGSVVEFGFGVDVEVLAGESAAAIAVESIYLGGKAYPGHLTIRPEWSKNAGVFDVTVTMPVEAYLPGVLGKELFGTWPRQTFEAQAVAARTYALQERERARTEGRASDVEDSTADQVFGGTSNLVVAVEAARATRGLVLMDQGKLIRAYFSSQCGGRPASAAEAWPMKKGREFNLAPALQGWPRPAYCQPAPLYRWTVTRTTEDVTVRLRAFGRGKRPELADLGRLRAITPAVRNAAGRPNRYTVSDGSGRECLLSAEELREALNWPLPNQAPITRENRIHSGDMEVTVMASEVRFAGRGFGHGVGMCQWCAKGMADAGLDWRSMVEQFYHGAEVRKIY